MNITIRINTSNDAFFPRAEDELARIFAELAERLKSDSIQSFDILRDVNGNFVGEVQVVDDYDEEEDNG